MVLDALPDEDFFSYNVHSVCTAAIHASLICSADRLCTDLKEEPSNVWGELSLYLL